MALLALSACAGPGPVTAPATNAYSTPLPSASAAQPAVQGEYVTVAGDTVYTVAQRNGVGVRALINENKLQPPYALQPSQHLRIPPQREHVVQTGETVYAIARRYQVPMAELVRIPSAPLRSRARRSVSSSPNRQERTVPSAVRRVRSQASQKLRVTDAMMPTVAGPPSRW